MKKKKRKSKKNYILIYNFVREAEKEKIKNRLKAARSEAENNYSKASVKSSTKYKSVIKFYNQ